MTETIRPEDLAVIRDARVRADLAAKEAEIITLRAFVRYGLTDADSFDIATGAITRASRAPDHGGPDGNDPA